MLDSYIENNINRKVKLLNTLLDYPKINFKKISDLLDIKINLIKKLINEINLELTNVLTITCTKQNIITKIPKNRSKLQLFHAIYEKSDVLHCIKYLLVEKEKSVSFLEYASENFTSVSNAYRYRKKCIYFLCSIGLKEEKNAVVGPEYRIRYLIALLHYKYGVNLYEIDDQSKKCIRTFVNSTNKVISKEVIEVMEEEYGFFEYLVFLSWKRTQYELNLPVSTEFDSLKKKLNFEKLKNSAKLIEQGMSIEFNESDYEYLFLVYCSTNNCLFADNWTPHDVTKTYNHFLFNNDKYIRLIDLFTERFGEKLVQNETFKLIIVCFLRKFIFNLQCIIPDNNFFVDKEANLNQKNCCIIMFSTIDKWRKDIKMSYPVDDKHVIYLSIQIEKIIRQFIEPVELILIADSLADLQILTSILRKEMATSIVITEFLIGVHDFNDLKLKKSSIFVLNKRFLRVVREMELDKSNRIAEVSIDFSVHQIEKLRKIISQYEENKFTEYMCR
ncbi:MAG: helix-turn-helix domain-containing protein [Enterococcus lacertideformus]|uniref:Helix-turn-helix domain-containing protein n=1 Tax=Enterococcus lacertideformus TaxID=2771493 RepID=A0A931FC24_9ENTE|nr:helix-turn-helix domain-containing protein [Enterococcus lacertideformus]